MVINKSLRVRVYSLASTILISLPLQIIFLGLSGLWTPDQPAYSVLALVVFFTTFLCAAAGEGILVIVPIADSLAAGGDSVWEDSGERLKNAGDSWDCVVPYFGIKNVFFHFFILVVVVVVKGRIMPFYSNIFKFGIISLIIRANNYFYFIKLLF